LIKNDGESFANAGQDKAALLHAGTWYTHGPETLVSSSFFSFSLFLMTLRSPRTVRRGFTLIELLLVIGIIAILASIVIVAINPTRQLAQARNAQRGSDVNTLLNAIYQYSIDTNGNLPGILSGSTAITNGRLCKTMACTETNSVNISRYLTGSYVVGMPGDPSKSTGSGFTGYNITETSNGRITVTSPYAELSQTISVTR
jgi:type IV pilus assembly protein PilA